MTIYKVIVIARARNLVAGALRVARVVLRAWLGVALRLILAQRRRAQRFEKCHTSGEAPLWPGVGA
ncbi:MAG: hypothetical protein WDO69_22750 [Pseudomonadota bacterium]